jgi:hypothetical protein
LPEIADPWREILRDAVEQIGGQPCVGTKFRSSVDAAAARQGLRFPPPNEPDLRFVELIERFPDIVSIARRPGQDFLVAPAGRTDLLAEGVQRRPYGIRRDLFEAFTFVGDGRLYYDKVLDKVVWQTDREASTPPDSCVPIEAPTLEGEIQLRRDFVASLPEDSGIRARFEKAFTYPRPLQAFGMVVREVGVQRKWHAFRTERVIERIESWARSRAIPWKDAWLTEGRSERLSEPANFRASASVGSHERDPLQVLFSGLDAADIQRISIPLDLVLKAISSSRKA